MNLLDKRRANRYTYKRLCLTDFMEEYGRANGLKGYLSSTDWNRLNFILKGEAHWKLIRSDTIEFSDLYMIVAHPLTKARLRKKFHKLIYDGFIKVKEPKNNSLPIPWNFKF